MSSSTNPPGTPPRPDLAAIEARASAATPGPWMWVSDERDDDVRDELMAGSADGVKVLDFGSSHSYDQMAGTEPSPADAAFIAAARTDVPALLSALRAAEAALATERHARAQAALEAGKALAERDATIARMREALGGLLAFCDPLGTSEYDNYVKARAALAAEAAEAAGAAGGESLAASADILRAWYPKPPKLEAAERAQAEGAESGGGTR